jgi:predicted nucleotide-binding protein
MKTYTIEDLVSELLTIGRAMLTWEEQNKAPNIVEPTNRLCIAAKQVAKAWSDSNIGYHSCVYYHNFVAPPPGTYFSSEWGLYGAFSEARDSWREYSYDDVLQHIHQIANNPDLIQIRTLSDSASISFEEAKSDMISLISTLLLHYPDDSFLSERKSDIEKLTTLTPSQATKMQLPQGTFWSRDALAMGQGLRSAPHQAITGELIAIKSVFAACSDLGKFATRTAIYVERRNVVSRISNVQGRNVFIGHGRSLVWRELKDFISDRLKLSWEEFNRVPVAGVTNISRLTQMLDTSGIAFLILTAEDERTDGTILARQNVVHEAGLFQGRLGFNRAIVLLEEGCELFSNIHGLGYISFSPGHIQDAFEDIRRVLEREGFIEE